MMSSLTSAPESITFLACEAERRAGLDGGAQHVAGGDLRDAEALADTAACVPLPAPGAPNRMSLMASASVSVDERRRQPS